MLKHERRSAPPPHTRLVAALAWLVNKLFQKGYQQNGNPTNLFFFMAMQTRLHICINSQRKSGSFGSGAFAFWTSVLLMVFLGPFGQRPFRVFSDKM
jgi:hypothetical protein